jgi:predicted patatin/cPLA2 family phospholipase
MKIGLVVEGGGMRGVISAGAIGCLLEEGYYDAFDACYGSSAGAMNLTYYLAQQPEGIKAYEEDLCDGAFLDIKRHLRRRMTVIKDAHVNFIRRGVARIKRRASSAESATISDIGTLAESNEDVSDDGSGNYSVSPAMNVNHLLDHVMGGLTGRPLNWRRVIESKVPLKVVATSLDTLSTVILEDFKDVGDLKMCLMASARVPALAGAAPVSHRGHRLVDAAVLEPVPVHAAACDGCTHMLVILTSPHPVAKNDDDASTSTSASVDVSQSMDDVRGSVDDSAEFDLEDASPRRANGGIRLMSSKKPKPASSALYRAIRNLLFSPQYMADIWDVHDALAETLNRRHGWRAKDVLTPDRAPSAFAPIKITTVAPNGPASKSMSSLCVDAGTIAAARVEGEIACRLILGLPAEIAIDSASDVVKQRA